MERKTIYNELLEAVAWTLDFLNLGIVSVHGICKKYSPFQVLYETRLPVFDHDTKT